MWILKSTSLTKKLLLSAAIALIATTVIVYLCLPAPANRVASQHLAALQSRDWKNLYRLSPERERADIGWTEDQFINFCNFLTRDSGIGMQVSGSVAAAGSAVSFDATNGRLRYDVLANSNGWSESHQRDVGRYVFYARRTESGQWTVAAAPAVLFLARAESADILDFHRSLADAMRNSNLHVFSSFEYGEAYTLERLQLALAGAISHSEVKVPVDELRAGY